MSSAFLNICTVNDMRVLQVPQLVHLSQWNPILVRGDRNKYGFYRAA